MHTTTIYNEQNCSNCIFYTMCSIAVTIPEVKNIAKKIILVEKDEIICRNGQPLKELYVVNQGILKSYEIKQDNKEYIYSFYCQNSVIGLEQIHNNKFDYMIQAITKAALCVVSIESINLLGKHKPEIYEMLLNLTSKHMSCKRYLFHIKSEQRLAGFLLEMIQRSNQSLDEFIKLPINQSDIANHLNLTAETVNRIFHRWEDRGIITDMNNKQFKLPDIEKLKQICT